MLGASLGWNLQHPLCGSLGHDSFAVVGQRVVRQILVVRFPDVSLYLHRCADVGMVPVAEHHQRR